jgi:CheY-like chemotaxis protein
MGGDVTISSEKGKGSTFLYTLSFARNVEHAETPNLLEGLRISVACNNEHESNSIVANLQSVGAVGLSADKPEQLDTESSILLIDSDHPQLHVFTDAFNNNQKTYARVIQLAEPHVFAGNKDNSGTWELMKPFSINRLLQRLGNSDGFNTLTSIGRLLSQNRTNVTTISPSAISVERILVVDDNEINVEVIKGMLESHVSVIFSASNGAEALSLLNRSHKGGALFDMVLLDCNMPVMDGFECVQRIRNGEAGEMYSHIPVIAITADAMLGDQENCLNAGMNDYLTKPIDSSLLFETIVKWSS